MDKKKTVLLVMPYHHNYTDYYWIPGNLIFLATTLKAAGYLPKIIDDRVLDRKQTITAVKENIDDAVLIGISASTGNQLKNALEIAKEIKAISKSMPIVFGGPFASAKPELTLSSDKIDYVISGQGEYPIVQLCDFLNGTLGDKNKIANLYYKKSGLLKKTSSPLERRSINELPELCYFDETIIDLNPYINPETRAINYSTSTGCMGQCSFCFWEDSYKLSFFSPERAVSQLMEFKNRLDIHNILFDDPTFFNNKKRALEITEQMIQKGLDVQWRANGRIDTMRNYTLDDFQQIRDAGCDVIHFGLEHGSKRILDIMRKNINIDDTINILKYTNKVGIQSRFHILIGNPTEEINDLKLTGDLIHELLAIDPELDYTASFFTPFPGNDMTHLAEEHGYTPPKTLDGYGDMNIFIYDYAKEDKQRRIEKPTNPWKIDFVIPWYGEEYSKKYLSAFRECIPERDSILTTNKVRIKAYKS